MGIVQALKGSKDTKDFKQDFVMTACLQFRTECSKGVELTSDIKRLIFEWYFFARQITQQQAAFKDI
ncbi:hypothetical protein E0H80_13090 [Acinetobacter sp. ANC 4779]|uniref:hypothetical protein n=1 Tax=Acinetobacter Taxon 24C TaxID=2839060 RepID=UPI0007D7A30A|nr:MULTISPECIES: hypothetical protein [Acinetobacter Taxon 24C]OAL81054.1 hypothetical protein AY606_14650 [Acinetobacter sp. SFB]TCB49239.1 hypothetical protein E0H80_13090 [Acinetobacter sp. ANC 4779]